MGRFRSGGWVALGTATGVLAGAIVVRFGAVLGVVGIIPLGVMVLVALSRALIRWPDDPDPQASVLRWALLSFGIHVVIGLAIASSDEAIYYLGADARTYHEGATDILAHWVQGHPLPSFPAGKEGYYYLLAALYWVFGPFTWGGVVLNALFAGAIVPIVTDTTHRLFGAAAARYAPILTVLVPGMIIWQAQLLKEAAFLLLVALATNCAVRLTQRISLLPLIGIALAVPALLTFRGQLGLVLIGGLVIGVIISRKEVAGGLFGTTIGIVLIATIVALGLGSAGYDAAVSSNLQQANAVRQGLATTANTGFAADADISTVGQAVSFLPQGIIVVTLGPFPWQLHGLRQLVAVPDIVAWWVLMVGLWWGQREARRTSGRRLMVLIFPAVATAVVLALAVGNYGALVRERMPILILLAPIMAFGFATHQAQRQADARLVPA